MSNPPTVFHALSTLQTAGAEITTVAVVARLRLAGVDARLATMRGDRDGLPAAEASRRNLPRSDLSAHRILSPGGLWSLTRLARRHRPCILHAEDRDAALLCAAASVLSGSPLVITRHVLDETGGQRGDPIKRFLLRRALRRAEVVVAVSQAVAARLTADDGVPADRLRVVHNAVDADEFPQLVSTEARRRLDWPEVVTIGLIGALRPGKGHQMAIAAANAVAATGRHVRFVFVGDGDLRAGLEANAPSSVEFLGARGDIPLVLAGCDLVILPSDAEAFPTVLIEAAAAGRPVIATDVGGIGEIVVDAATGIVVPPGDLAAFTAAIISLLDDPPRRTLLGSAARLHAIEQFSPMRQIESLLEIYKRLWP